MTVASAYEAPGEAEVGPGRATSAAEGVIQAWFRVQAVQEGLCGHGASRPCSERGGAPSGPGSPLQGFVILPLPPICCIPAMAPSPRLG